MIGMQEQKNIAWAAATDAANQHMKNHGRKVWAEADYNYAVNEYNYLLPSELKGECHAD
jgi:hypothetical protein